MTQQTYGQSGQQNGQHQPMPSPDDVLGSGGGGAPSLRFGRDKFGNNITQPGQLVGGRIVAKNTFHVTRQKGEERVPQYYPKSGDPIYGVIVDVQTDQRDPEIDDDNGVRRIYVEGRWTDDYKSRRRAVIEAIAATGAKGLEVGGELYIGWAGLVDVGAASPAYDMIARYVPAKAAQVNAVLSPPVQQPQQQWQAPAQPVQQQPASQPPAYTPAPATQWQQPPQTVQQQTAPAVTPASLTAEQVAVMRGMSDDQLSALAPAIGSTLEAVQAALAAHAPF